MITKKYYKLIRVSYEDQQYLTLTNTSGTVGGFSVSKSGNPSSSNLEYSLNGVDWTTYDLTNLPTVEVPIDGHIYLRGNNSNGFNRSHNDYYKLAMSTSFTASGNPFSLRNTDPATFGAYTRVLNAEFCGLFYESNITDASGLVTSQITSVDNYGFRYMFFWCYGLTTPPDLSGVTSIGTYGCREMFASCNNLTTGPNLSNVTSIGSDSCYQMFIGCSLLSEVIAPNISTWNVYTFENWLAGAGTSATSTKIFKAPTGLEIPTGDSGIPSGWTRVDY